MPNHYQLLDNLLDALPDDADPAQAFMMQLGLNFAHWLELLADEMAATNPTALNRMNPSKAVFSILTGIAVADYIAAAIECPVWAELIKMLALGENPPHDTLEVLWNENPVTLRLLQRVKEFRE